MKNLFAIICAVVLLTMASQRVEAQCEFPNGTLGINLGLGFGSSDSGDKITVPSFNCAVDYGFLPNIINSNGCISGGGYFSIGRGSCKYKDNSKHITTQWRVGTRGALHYTWVRNLDTYAGVALGVKSQKYKIKNSPISNYIDVDVEGTVTNFDSHIFGGARYKFGNVAVFSELATTSFCFFQIGISFLI